MALFFFKNAKLMEKETLLTEFKKVLGEPTANGYLGDTGVTMRTLDKYVDAILPTITSDEAVNDEFYTTHANVIKAMGGQMRFEQSEFAKNYKPAPPKKVEKPKVEPDEASELLKIQQRIEALEKERMDDVKKSEISRMRTAIAGKSETLRVSNKPLWEDAVKMVEVTDGMDESAMETKAKEIYESKLKSYFGNGAAPYGSDNGGGTGEQDKAALDSFFAKKAREGKFPEQKQSS